MAEPDWFIKLALTGFPAAYGRKIVRYEVGHWIAGERHGFSAKRMPVVPCAT